MTKPQLHIVDGRDRGRETRRWAAGIIKTKRIAERKMRPVPAPMLTQEDIDGRLEGWEMQSDTRNSRMQRRLQDPDEPLPESWRDRLLRALGLK